MILKKNFFLKSMILDKKISLKSIILSEILNFFRLVRFWIKVFITCQILNQLFKYPSGFDLNIIQHVRFCVYFFCCLPSFHMSIKTVRFAKVWTYGMGSVSQVILLG